MDRPIDRIRALTEGTLDPGDARELRAELERDPELARLAADFGTVHELTAGLPAPPPSRATFAELEARIAAAERAAPSPAVPAAPRTWRRRRRVAAAAVLLLAGAAALVRLLPGAAPPVRPAPVRLAAVPLAAGPVPEPRPGPPAALASYEPVVDGRIQWLQDLDLARDTARWSGRALLVFGMTRDCPICLRVRQTVLVDERLLRIAEDVVPVQVDLAALVSDDEAAALSAAPFLELQEADGTSLLHLYGDQDAGELEVQLGMGLEDRDGPAGLPTWSRLRADAGLLARARAAEAEGHLGTAEALYRELATSPAPGFRAAARSGLQALGLQARELLEEARRRAAADPHAALRLLREGAARFAGSALASDLAAVARELERTSLFPPLLPRAEGAVRAL